MGAKKLAKLCYAVLLLFLLLLVLTAVPCTLLARRLPGQVRSGKLSRLMVAVYQIAFGYSCVPRSILFKISF